VPNGIDKIAHLVSRDGQRFVALTPVSVPPVVFTGSIVPMARRMRAYVSSGRGVRSLLSDDGRAWHMEAGVRMANAWDPAVVRLPDGSYLMLCCRRLDEKARAFGQTVPAASLAAYRHKSVRTPEAQATARGDAVATEHGTSAEQALLGGAADGLADPLAPNHDNDPATLAELEDVWSDLVELPFPPMPDFTEPVDYVQWCKDFLLHEQQNDALDVYATFLPGPWSSPGTELPAFDNLFTEPGARRPPVPWDPSLHPAWEDANLALQAALDGFRAASKRAGCGLPPIFPEGPGPSSTCAPHRPLLIDMLLPGLSDHRNLARATLADAWRIRDGGVSAPRMLEAWETVLRNADHLSQGATLISQLVGLSERIKVRETARWALYHDVFDADQQQAALETLQKHDRATDHFTSTLRGEYATSMQLTQFLFWPEKPGDPPSLNRENFESLRDDMVGWGEQESFVDAVQTMTPDDVWASIEAFDAYNREVAAQLEVGYPAVRSGDLRRTAYKYRDVSPLTRILLPSLGGLGYHRARGRASHGATQLAYAAHIFKHRQGHWPASLNELAASTDAPIPTDPFTGRDFGYKLTDDGPHIYSAWENGRDDGGIHAPKRKPDPDDETASDDRVFWPPQSP
jgi:hypothetical protein